MFSDVKCELIVFTGSSPCDRSSITSSPVNSNTTTKQENFDSSQLHVPTTPSRQFRSKSFDVSLSDLKLEDAIISIDMSNNEITITPTGVKKFEDHVHFSAADEKLEIGDKISRAFDTFEGGIVSCNEGDKADKEDDTKITIKGPGSYIKKLIQQFSEGPFETEDVKTDSEKAVSTESIKNRADAICKKCFHYKGRIHK